METTEVTCAVCKKTIIPEKYSTGYGIVNNEKICYSCCAELDLAAMRRGDKITMYLDMEKGTVSNWPGSLVIPINNFSISRHNMAGFRYDVWFWAGARLWHGVTYGRDTQLCHCTAIKWNQKYRKRHLHQYREKQDCHIE